MSISEDLGLKTEFKKASQPRDSCYAEYYTDKKYAWAILIICFFIHTAGVGTAMSAGTFSPVLLDEFNGARKSVGLIGSFQIGFIFLAGPLAGLLADRVGYRVTVVGGAILASGGVALGTFATEVWMLCITVGVVGGTGISFVFIPSITLLSHYFKKWRAVAFTISFSGIGVGTLIMPLYIKWAIGLFGWRGAYLMTAGVILQISVAGLLITMKDINQKQTLATTIKEQLTALCSWRFFLFWVSNSLFGFGSAIVFVFIPDYAEQKGLSFQQAVYILSTLGLCNAIGRLLNILLSLCRCNHGNIYIMSCTLSGICICLMNIDLSGSSNSFLALAITCSSYGLFYGIQLANVATVTSILSPQPFLNTAFGLTNLAAGVGTICGSPAAAFFFSIGGDRFELTYYIAGGATMLAGLILLPTICLKTPVSQVCDETE